MQGKQHYVCLVNQGNEQEVTHVAAMAMFSNLVPGMLQAKMPGVLPVKDGVFGPLQSGANTWGNMLTQAAAACNGLIMVNRSTVVGDELETALFKAVEARFLVSQRP